jgi:hypothetical protein
LSSEVDTEARVERERERRQMGGAGLDTVAAWVESETAQRRVCDRRWL